MEHNSEFLKLSTAAKAEVTEIGVAEVAQLNDANEAYYLIDVREDHEWAKGHLPKAMHLGRGIIERDIEKLVADKTAKIVLYCGGGHRSALAAVNLVKMGYTQVLSMAGGIGEWKSAGLPIEG